MYISLSQIAIIQDGKHRDWIQKIIDSWPMLPGCLLLSFLIAVILAGLYYFAVKPLKLWLTNRSTGAGNV